MSSRTVESASCGNQGDADAGRDEALDGLVVVALEGHARLEAGRVAGAHDVARAGAGGRGLHPRLALQVLEAQPSRRASACSRGQREVHRVVQQLEARAVRRAEPLARAANSNSSARSNSPARRRGTISSGSPSARLSSTSGWAARKVAIATRHQRGAGGREGGHAQPAAAHARRSPPARPRPPPGGRGCPRRARRALRRPRSGARRARWRSSSVTPVSASSARDLPARPPTACRRARRRRLRRSRGAATSRSTLRRCNVQH